MAFDASQAQRHVRVGKVLDDAAISMQGGSARLPDGPGLGRGHALYLVAPGQAAMIGPQQIRALGNRDWIEKVLPVIRK
jgi:hypothetical protein